MPLVKSYLAQFAARAIIAELVSVAELAHPLENGTHFPLFLLCLQQTAKLKDREWLTDLFQQSKVNMQKMLPGRPPIHLPIQDLFIFFKYRNDSQQINLKITNKHLAIVAKGGGEASVE